MVVVAVGVVGVVAAETVVVDAVAPPVAAGVGAGAGADVCTEFDVEGVDVVTLMPSFQNEIGPELLQVT